MNYTRASWHNSWQKRCWRITYLSSAREIKRVAASMKAMLCWTRTHRHGKNLLERAGPSSVPNIELTNYVKLYVLPTTYFTVTDNMLLNLTSSIETTLSLIHHQPFELLFHEAECPRHNRGTTCACRMERYSAQKQAIIHVYICKENVRNTP